MFDPVHLDVLRQHEFGTILPFLPRGSRILEIGGGSGVQAQKLAESGYEVRSIDLASSNYKDRKIFLVQEYNGVDIPFPDHSFDLVFSSNVMEHVTAPDQLHREMQRVLVPGGLAIHIMPTGVWRIWSTVTHYAEIPRKLVPIFSACASALLRRGRTTPGQTVERVEGREPRSDRASNPPPPSFVRKVGQLLLALREMLLCRRHGEKGNAVSEIYLFSRWAWHRELHRLGWDLERSCPMGLFYTGNMLLGPRLSFPARARLARLLGSACRLYIVRASADSDAAGYHRSPEGQA